MFEAAEVQDRRKPRRDLNSARALGARDVALLSAATRGGDESTNKQNVNEYRYPDGSRCSSISPSAAGENRRRHNAAHEELKESTHSHYQIGTC